MPSPALQPPSGAVVMIVSAASPEVQRAVAAYNRAAHRRQAAERLTAKTLYRAGRTSTVLEMMGKHGQVLAVQMTAPEPAALERAIAMLASAAESDAPASHLRDPGREGKNVAAAPEEAPRNVLTIAPGGVGA